MLSATGCGLQVDIGRFAIFAVLTCIVKVAQAHGLSSHAVSLGQDSMLRATAVVDGSDVRSTVDTRQQGARAQLASLTVGSLTAVLLVLLEGIAICRVV